MSDSTELATEFQMNLSIIGSGHVQNESELTNNDP